MSGLFLQTCYTCIMRWHIIIIMYVCMCVCVCVCVNVHTEPTLQPLQGEPLKYKSANGEVGARLDVAAQNFWGKDHQTAYFDVRIFNPFAQSYANSSMSKCYRKHELDKKREYEERVREIEHGSFSPLVFSTAGGMGPIATTVYKRIASLIADKRQEPYSTTLYWLRCTEFFLTSLSNHVPSRNQVISFPLTTPFYSFCLCRGKGPLKNFSIGLVYLIKFLFCIFILYPLCIIIIVRLTRKKKKTTSIYTFM